MNKNSLMHNDNMIIKVRKSTWTRYYYRTFKSHSCFAKYPKISFREKDLGQNYVLPLFVMSFGLEGVLSFLSSIILKLLDTILFQFVFV